MKKKTFFGMLFGVLFVSVISFLFASKIVGDAKTASLFEMNGTTLVRYTGDSEVVTVPSNVKVIGKGAFEGNTTMMKLVLPKGLEAIEYNAFAECVSLLETDIPDSVTEIGSAAFANCKNLCDLSIGKGLSAMGSGVFAGCVALSDIEVNTKSNTFTCVDGVLYDAGRTRIYQYLPGREKPFYRMPDTVEEIGQYAFWGADSLEHLSVSDSLQEVSPYAFSNAGGLKSVALNFNTEEIEMKAFEDCISLEQIYIPDSVRYIHETAFDGCPKVGIYAMYYSKGASFAKENNIPLLTTMRYSLTQVDVSEEEYWADKKEEKAEEDALVIIPSNDTGLIGKTSIISGEAVVLIDRYEAEVCLGDHVKWNEELLNNITDGVIDKNAFYMRSDLKQVEIPEEVTKIDQFAFARSGLTSIVIPDGVTHIGYGAFYHCEDLSEVVIPDTVKTIEMQAFEHTSWLQNWYDNSEEEYLIVGDGILLAYKGDAKTYKKPAGVKTVACEIK